MKTRTLQFFNYLLTLVLSVLGIQSCKNDGNDDEILCMYGQPYAEFSIDVCVMNEQGQGIPNEKVLLRPCDEKGEALTYQYADTIHTDLSGVAKHKFHAFPGKTVRAVTLNESGTYFNDSVQIKFEKVKEGDGDWYYGEYSGKAELTLKDIEFPTSNTEKTE